MKKNIFLIIILGSVLFSCGKKINISMVTATSLENGLPFGLLAGREWKSGDNARYVKMHIYNDEAIKVASVKAESCGNDFTDDVNVYINFDETVAKALKKGDIVEAGFNPPVSARSITLNFNKNKNICLKNLNIFDENNRKYNIEVPKAIKAKVTASQTGQPVESYNVMNLFDSRYENAYASSDRPDITIAFNFEEQQKITSLKIWNGYQRSDIHCISNGRVKEMTITGDDNYSETHPVEDLMGPQIIKLNKPFNGKNLTLKVNKSYKGTADNGIAISELRFYNDDHVLLIDPHEYIKTISQKYEKKLREANLSEILNQGLTGVDSSEDIEKEPENTAEEINQENPSAGDTNTASAENNQTPPPTDEQAPQNSDEQTPPAENVMRLDSNWILRLRSDGSMFLQGSTRKVKMHETGEENLSNTFFALGNFEIKSVGENYAEMKLFGFLRKMENSEFLEYGMQGDCNGCGRDCNILNNQDPGKQEKLFYELIKIVKIDGRYFIKKIKASENLDFDQLEMKIDE